MLQSFLLVVDFVLFQVALIGFNVLGDTVDGRELNTVVSELLPD